jgi:hypothetical protein
MYLIFNHAERHPSSRLWPLVRFFFFYVTFRRRQFTCSFKISAIIFVLTHVMRYKNIRTIVKQIILAHKRK